MTNKIGFVYGKEAKERTRNKFIKKHKQTFSAILFLMIFIGLFLFLTR